MWEWWWSRWYIVIVPALGPHAVVLGVHLAVIAIGVLEASTSFHSMVVHEVAAIPG